jgi:SAM-dependent methyltransferase
VDSAPETKANLSKAELSKTSSWREFWDRDNAIYVSQRHKLLHYRLVAGDIRALVPGPGAIVLDHGCGEALEAGLVAQVCSRLYLCDAAPSVVAKLKERFAANPRIVPLTPDALSTIPDAGLDLIVANSLLQYLSQDELLALLAIWKGKLRPGGLLVVADVITPDAGPVTDALALLRFGWKGGFFMGALAGLVRTALSDYRSLRAALGLSTHTQAGMESLLHGAGFTNVRRRDANLGHNQARMTFVAQVRAI